MRKNKLGLMCMLLLMAYSSFGQDANNEKAKALEALKTIKLQEYYQNGLSELYADYEKLKKENESLEKKLETKNDEIIGLETKLKYLLLREQIETGKLSNQGVKDIAEVRYIDSIGKQIIVHFFNNGSCYECKTFFSIDSPYFKQLFPLTYNGIKKGTIILNDTLYTPLDHIQIKRVSFPHIIVTPKTTNEQKVMADLYLQFIKEINSTRKYKFDVYALYLELEKEKVPNKELVKLITLRGQYIVYLKSLSHDKK
jgi:hypothetical protein